MKKTSSLVWRVFDRIEENNRCVAVLCKLCETQYKYFGNTTNLRTHLVNKHPIQWDLLQTGNLDESTFRAYDDDESTNQTISSKPKRRRYKTFKAENIDMPSDTDIDNNDLNDEVHQSTINIVREMQGGGSDEEWLEEDLYPTHVEAFEPKRKKIRTIKREIQSPPLMRHNFVVRNPVRHVPPSREVVKKDEYTVFGEYVGNKLRKLKSQHARGNIQHLISTVLWQGEYGMYDSVDAVKRVILSSIGDMETETVQAPLHTVEITEHRLDDSNEPNQSNTEEIPLN